MSIKNGHIRWVFDLKSWRCTFNELELATACIQPEEKERLEKFVFLDDFKASIIGRLLMRRFIKCCLPELDYNAVRIERDARGKPYFKANGQAQIDFNVSHHERYTVIAGSFTQHQNPNDIQTENIGVDIMNTIYTGGKPLTDFFRIMQRTFTPNEWHFIRGRNNEQQQSAAFMRHWCLKESYVKTIGVGILINLQSVDFRFNTEQLTKNQIIRDTVAYVDGKPLSNWMFEESLLDDEHCISVAVKDPTPEYLELSPTDLTFQLIDFDTLIEDVIKIRPTLTIDTEYCQRIIAKELKKSV